MAEQILKRVKNETFGLTKENLRFFCDLCKEAGRGGGREFGLEEEDLSEKAQNK